MSDFKPITLQHIFNLAWQAFVVEKRPPARMSKDNGSFCAYLTDDGRKCAVGLALPNGHDAQKSDLSFGALIDNYPSLFDISMDLERASYFQRSLHDEISTRDGAWDQRVNIELQYRKVAYDYGLTIPGEQP